jgi:hypothetical protein
MPRQNRVTPTGDLIATPVRGTLMGNRGCLHDTHGKIRRHHQGRRWIYCRLAFNDRHRAVMTPGRYTELFFLDEVTALAAGHRPCAECLRSRFDLFRICWAAANPELASQGLPTTVEIDHILQQERICNGQKVTFRQPLSDIPAGVFFLLAGQAVPCLKTEQGLLTWSAEGYMRRSEAAGTEVEVLTPYSVVRMLTQDYPYGVHPSAAAGPG